MSGIRLVCDEFIPVTSWDQEFVVVNTPLVDDIPLPCIVSFDLFNPLDNSGNGFLVSKAGGIIKPYGLDFKRDTGGSSTDFTADESAITLLCAVRPNSTGTYSVFLDSLITTAGAGSGLSIDYSATGKIRVRGAYPSGSLAIYEFPTALTAGWNIICLSVSEKTIRAINQESEVIGATTTGSFNSAKWAAPLSLGKSNLGSGTCDGSVGFVSVYRGSMTDEQMKSAIAVGAAVMASRN